MLPRDVVLYVNRNIMMMLIENIENAFNQLTDKKKFHTKNCEIYNSKNFMMEDYLINMETQMMYWKVLKLPVIDIQLVKKLTNDELRNYQL